MRSVPKTKQAGIGAVIPLEESEQYVEWLERYAAMDEAEFQKISDQAIQYAHDNSNIDEMADRYREMFEGDLVVVKNISG